MSGNAPPPRLTERQKEEKANNIAKQERINEDGQRRFERRQGEEDGSLKESVARKMFGGGLTYKQELDLPRKTFVSSGTPYRHGIDPPIMEGKIARRIRLEREREERKKMKQK